MKYYKIGKAGALAGWLGLLLSVMVTLLNKPELGNIGLLGSIFLFAAAHAAFWKGRESISAQTRWGCAMIALFFCLFWDAALLAPGTVKTHVVNMVVIGVFLHVFFVLWAGLAWKKRRECQISARAGQWLPVLVIIGLFWLLSVETLDDWFRWDSRCYVVYMRLAEGFDFTLQSVRDLNLVGHLALGFSLPALTLGNLIGDMGLACRIMNMLEASLAIACFYGIVNYFIPDERKTVKVLGTAVFAFSPWLLGLVGEVSLDYASLCCLVAMIYFALRKNHVMQLLFAFQLCFSKEPGIILCTAYAGGYFLTNFAQSTEKNIGKRILTGLFQKNCILYAIPILTWMGMYLVNTRWGAGDSFHYFGLVPSYAEPKLRAMIFVNFNWLLIAVILIAGVWAVLRKRKKERRLPWEDIWPMICSLAGFTAFGLVFVTYNHARYLLPQFFFLALFAVLALSGSGAKTAVKTGVLGVMTILLGIQSFWSIDIVARRLSGFSEINMGAGYVLSTNWIAPPDNMGDPIVYNRQYSYLDETLRRVFDEIPLSEDTVILLPSPYQGVSSYGYAEEYVFYNLLGDFSYSKTEMYWNPADRVLCSDEGEDSQRVEFELLNAQTVQNLAPAKELYYLSFPWIEDDEEILEACAVLEEQKVSYRSCEITVKHLKVKS